MKTKSAPDVTEQPAAPTGVACSDLLGHIPPKSIKRRNEHEGGNVADALRDLKVGDSIELPMSRENGVRASAECIGIKITSRRLGRTDKITVWRVA